MAKTNESISFEKIENGYLIRYSYEENTGKNYKYTSKQYYAKTAKDTKTQIADLSKKMNIK